MRVLFFWFNLNCPPRMNIGVSLLVREIKDAGHEAGVVYLNNEIGQKFDLGEIVEKCRDFDPDLFALSFGSNHFSYAKELAGELRKCFPEKRILCGGLHASLKPEEVIGLPGVDYLCLGDGDGLMAGFINRLESGGDIERTPGFWIKKESGIVRNRMETLPDISGQACIDTDEVDHAAIIEANRGIFETIASRGCPNSCTFCFNHALRKAYAENMGKPQGGIGYFRQRGVENVIEELKLVLSRHGKIIKLISFADDALNYSKEWFMRFCRVYRKEIGLPYTANIFLNGVDEEVARGLYESGCSIVRVGLECANEEIRRKVLGKPFNTQQAIQAFQILNRHGVNIRTYLMAGIPGETRDDILSTFRMVARLGIDSTRLCVFYPLPGTEIYDYCVERRLLARREWDNFDTVSILKWPADMMLFIEKTVAVFDWIQNMYLDSPCASEYGKLVDKVMGMSGDEWNSGESKDWIEETVLENFKRFHEMKVVFYHRPFPESPYTSFLYNKPRRVKIVNVDE